MSRYDISRFKPPPDDEFLCGICMNVLDDPKESPCRHVFCKVCIIRALQEKSKCPICRTSFKERHLKDVLPLVQNLLNKLQMECDHRAHGCQDPISLEVYLGHVASCDFMMVTCNNALCDQLVLRQDLDQHETVECLYRTFVCDQGCQCHVLFTDKDSHDCLQTLLQKYKEARERIQQLEETVKELRAQETKSGVRDGGGDNRDHAYLASPRIRNDLGSPFLSDSSSSSLRFGYSISSGNASDIDLDGLMEGRSPSISLSIGSDCSDDDDDDDDDYDEGGWPTSRRNRRIRDSVINDDSDNNDGEQEVEVVQDEADPVSDWDGGEGGVVYPGRDRNSNNDREGLCAGRGSVEGNMVDDGDGGSGNGGGGADVGEPGTSNRTGNRGGNPSSNRKRAGEGVGREGFGNVRAAKRPRLEEGEEDSGLLEGLEDNSGGSSDFGDVDHSSTTPLRRSARLCNLPAQRVSDLEDVRTPMTASALLEMYVGDDDWSSDDSWSPGHVLMRSKVKKSE